MDDVRIPAPGVKPTGLLPVAKVKTYKAKDAEKIVYDVAAFTSNEVRTLMVLIAEQETAAQLKLDNPPAFVNVDNVSGKSILTAKRRITISFGARLKVSALADLKRGLMQAIEASTQRVTGTLSNPRNWTYRYIRNGKVQPLPIGGASGIPMGPRDLIVLVPTNVVNRKGQAYATAANMRVAGSGKLSFRRSTRGRVSRRNASIGFLALAARSATASPAFAGFSVSVGFTRGARAVPGEVTRKGGTRTGYLRIRPKTGKGRRRG